MSSIKYLRDNGATKLAALLTIIRAKPIKTRFLLGQMMVLKAFRILTLLSDIGDLAIFYYERVQFTVKLPSIDQIDKPWSYFKEELAYMF